jgi:sulfur carrier protein
MVNLRVNGEEAEVNAGTIAELLAQRGIDPAAKFLAVAVNGNVVRRAEWPNAALSPGDQVEIVRPLQGG